MDLCGRARARLRIYELRCSYPLPTPAAAVEPPGPRLPGRAKTAPTLELRLDAGGHADPDGPVTPAGHAGPDASAPTIAYRRVQGPRQRANAKARFEARSGGRSESPCRRARARAVVCGRGPAGAIQEHGLNEQLAGDALSPDTAAG